MVRTKQDFPYASYSKIVDAILKGYQSPNDMLEHKVLSKRKLHTYLKMFSNMGFLIRKRLSKRGNYVEYNLNLDTFFIPLFIKADQKMAKWMNKEGVRKRLELEWELSHKPLGILRKERKYRKLLNKLSKEKGWKEVKLSNKVALLTQRRIKSTPILDLRRKYGKYFEQYPLLDKLIPLLIYRKSLMKVGNSRIDFLSHLKEMQVEDIVEIIDKIKNDVICPECMKKVTLQKYLCDGTKSLPFLLSQKDTYFCPFCDYRKERYFEQQV